MKKVCLSFFEKHTFFSALYFKGFRLSGKVFHPFPTRKIKPRSNCIVGGVILTTKAVPEWEPERGAFLTVATFHMRRRVRELLGIRTTKTRIENMGTASLDVALDDENDTPLVEQIIDPAALDPEEAALQADMQRIVWESVTRLPEEQRSAIEAAYFSEGGRGGKAVRKALHTLRRDKRLILLWREYEGAAFHVRSSPWKYTHTSSVEAAAMQRERIREQIAALMRHIG